MHWEYGTLLEVVLQLYWLQGALSSCVRCPHDIQVLYL